MPRTEDQRPIVVRSFPASDRDFAEATGAALLEARADEPDASTLRDVVERRLRASYRNVRISTQDELADLNMQEIVWYAYRDGRIRETDPSRERFYAAVATARRTVRETQATLEQSRSLSRRAGFDDEGVQAHGAGEAPADEAGPGEV